ncbi:hypothetical protein SRB5_45690 [Streptomyces sp. RB5]|uniref:Histidine kinase/HSP90-like ATPase domain-containing protein n=1 Tax=Streptomyces smaragdinus TaxID=2585196 RepID=A0A7K0CMY9_9ACTN|nr:hypothetical protein [Streptomyces smaragdinus]
MIASELVTNSVAHTPSRFLQVIATRLTEDRVCVIVADTSTASPSSGSASQDDEHGRGLAIVEAIADRTGTDTFVWGKRSWAELTTAPPPGS